MQLWIFEEKNWFVEQIHDALYSQLGSWYNFDCDDTCQEYVLDPERNLYNGDYPVGTADGIIDIIDSNHSDDSDIYRRLLYEIKPRLYDKGGTARQIKKYAFRTRYLAWNDNEEDERYSWPFMVVITADPNTRFDRWFNHQNIAILRVTIPIQYYGQ